MEYRKREIKKNASLAVKNNIPLRDLIETTLKILLLKAPKGAQPFYVSVQPNGRILRTELVGNIDDESIADEPAVRKKKGETFTKKLREDTEKVHEKISLLEMDIREAQETIREEQGRRDEVVRQAGNYFSERIKAYISLGFFLLIAFAEIGALYLVFSDRLGFDPFKMDLLKNPASILYVLVLTIGFFMPILLIAKKVLYSKRRWLWAAPLVFAGLLIGKMRSEQAAAVQDGAMSDHVIMAILFALLGIALPLAAAAFMGVWEATSKKLSNTRSSLRNYDEVLGRHKRRLNDTIAEHRQANRQLIDNVNIYVKDFQDVSEEERRCRLEWENHFRYVEAYLAELRMAYLCYEKSKTEEHINIKSIIKFIPLTLAALLGLALFLVGCSNANSSKEKFKMTVICDRSSSGGEYSCTSEKLIEAGRMWVGLADKSEGGSFEAYVIDKGIDSTYLFFTESYPERFNGPVLANKKKWQAAFEKKLSTASKALPGNKGSAVAEAIYRAALRSPTEQETTIVIMSDLREVDERFNFEKNVPDPKEFFSWLSENGIHPRLGKRTQIQACGVHPYSPTNTAKMNAVSYEKLMKLWQAVFNEWGIRATISETCDFNP